MDPANFMMLNNEFLNKDIDVVSEQASLNILDSKSALFMDKNGKETKHTRQNPRIMNFVRNGIYCSLYKTVWYDISLQLAEIVTNNVREYELNYRLGNAMLALDNIQNTCLGEVLQYIRFLMIMCYE